MTNRRFEQAKVVVEELFNNGYFKEDLIINEIKEVANTYIEAKEVAVRKYIFEVLCYFILSFGKENNRGLFQRTKLTSLLSTCCQNIIKKLSIEEKYVNVHRKVYQAGCSVLALVVVVGTNSTKLKTLFKISSLNNQPNNIAKLLHNLINDTDLNETERLIRQFVDGAVAIIGLREISKLRQDALIDIVYNIFIQNAPDKRTTAKCLENQQINERLPGENLNPLTVFYIVYYKKVHPGFVL